jgi:hypothetical protein
MASSKVVMNCGESLAARFVKEYARPGRKNNRSDNGTRSPDHFSLSTALEIGPATWNGFLRPLQSKRT